MKEKLRCSKRYGLLGGRTAEGAEEKVEWLQQILISPSLKDLHEVEKNTWRSALTKG